jgi:GDP-L-fucose synthase
MLNKNSRIFIAGHKGTVGSEVLQLLKDKKYKNIITIDKNKLDLTNKKKTFLFFKKKKIDYLIIAAAKVGGIEANNRYPTEFLINNLEIQNNLLSAALYFKIKRTIFLGSSCVYPKKNLIPIREEYLLKGQLEKTNEKYAIAKIAGIKLCEAMFYQYNLDTVTLMPTNVYGIKDNFDKKNGHVIGAMFSKFIKAKKSKKNVMLIGTGKARREFLHSNDLAEAILFILKLPQKKILKVCNNQYPIINVGSGKSIKIFELANIIKKISGFSGKILFNNNAFFDGTLNKNICSKKINKLGWYAKKDFIMSLKEIYKNVFRKI